MDRLNDMLGTNLEFNASTIGPVVFVVFVLDRIWTYYKNIKVCYPSNERQADAHQWHIAQSVNNLPRLYTLFEPVTPRGAGLPSNSWNIGLNFQWTRRLDRMSPHQMQESIYVWSYK